MDRDLTILELTERRNRDKFLFTAGPASLLPENITGLRPCFGRGDNDYEKIEQDVLERLRKFSGHREIVRLQGSASLALEIMSLNFLYGKVLVVSTGYYSDRMHWLAESALRRIGEVRHVDTASWDQLGERSGSYDWVVACPVETSCGLKLPITTLERTASDLNAKLMLDATASIGLEDGHEAADVLAYSSCKGLFGLTGAAFIAFNKQPENEVDSFYLNLDTHLKKGMTGPYHTLASLSDVLPRHAEFREAVKINKEKFMIEMRESLQFPAAHQPLLCTYVNRKITARDSRAILYHPRSELAGSVVCHLGEVHLGRDAKGEILDILDSEPVVKEEK